MKILTANDLLLRLNCFKNEMSKEEWDNLKVVLGDDEELNGMHYGFYCDFIIKGKDKFMDEIAKWNIEDKKYILIS